MYVLIQVMDDRWEKEVMEFGAINITGFRVLDFSRKVVRDFFHGWNKDSLSVSCEDKLCDFGIYVYYLCIFV